MTLGLNYDSLSGELIAANSTVNYAIIRTVFCTGSGIFVLNNRLAAGTFGHLFAAVSAVMRFICFFMLAHCCAAIIVASVVVVFVLMTKSLAFNCATNLTSLGKLASCVCPIMIVAAKASFASVAPVIVILVLMTEFSKNFCVCMISVVSTCVCLNAVFCTSRSCCYFASVVMRCSVYRNFFCVRIAAFASISHNTWSGTRSSLGNFLGVCMSMRSYIIVSECFSTCYVSNLINTNCKEEVAVSVITDPNITVFVIKLQCSREESAFIKGPVCIHIFCNCKSANPSLSILGKCEFPSICKVFNLPLVENTNEIDFISGNNHIKLYYFNSKLVVKRNGELISSCYVSNDIVAAAEVSFHAFGNVSSIELRFPVIINSSDLELVAYVKVFFNGSVAILIINERISVAPTVHASCKVPFSTNKLCNYIGFLFVTNRALAALFAIFNVVRSLGLCPFAPSVLSKLTSGFATSCTCFGNKTSSSLPVVTKSFAFNRATNLTSLGKLASCVCPIMIVAAKASFASVAPVIVILVLMTEFSKNFCVCMISVVSTCVCLNAVFCTSRSCCYFASVVMGVFINRNFFCVRIAAFASVSHNTWSGTCSGSSYLGYVIVLMNEGVLSPFAVALIPSALCNYVAVSIICRNNEVRCLIPLIIPVIFCSAGVHTAEDYIDITLIDVCFPNAVPIFISHIDPKLAVTEEINCKSCIIDLPISIGNKIENYCNLGFNRFFDLYNLNSKIAIEINRELICSGNFN